MKKFMPNAKMLALILSLFFAFLAIKEINPMGFTVAQSIFFGTGFLLIFFPMWKLTMFLLEKYDSWQRN